MTERRRVRPGSILFLLLLVLCVFTLARNIGAGDSGIAYSQMCQYFREEKVQSFTITGDSLQASCRTARWWFAPSAAWRPFTAT